MKRAHRHPEGQRRPGAADRPFLQWILYLALSLALLSALPGCIYRGSAVTLSPESLRQPDWVGVTALTFQGQQAPRDCGPAALAMVLTYQGTPTTIGEVATVCMPDPKNGAGAGQLRNYARLRGHSSFLVRGELTDLERELAKGRPVIVGLLKPTLRQPVAHYEVVVGLNRKQGLVATLDPARGWRSNSVAGFLKEWDPADRLMLVVMPPEGPPLVAAPLEAVPVATPPP